jgi:hypothetical protein
VTLSPSNRSSWCILLIPAEASASVSHAEAMSDSICSVLMTDIESVMKVLGKIRLHMHGPNSSVVLERIEDCVVTSKPVCQK